MTERMLKNSIAGMEEESFINLFDTTQENWELAPRELSKSTVRGITYDLLYSMTIIITNKEIISFIIKKDLSPIVLLDFANNPEWKFVNVAPTMDIHDILFSKVPLEKVESLCRSLYEKAFSIQAAVDYSKCG